MTEKKTTIQDSVRILLEEIGEDPNREGLIGTPDRVEKMYQEICSGYQQDLVRIVNRAVFREKVDGMVIVRDIVFYSLCEHHLLPFSGKVHVAYLPNEQIIGLSIPRIVEMFSKRLQVQERLTVQIKDALEDVLSPHGTAVMIEAKHLCAKANYGVKRTGKAGDNPKF